MPHVVIKGPISPEDIWLAFQPLEFREGGNLYKADEAYLAVDKKSLVVRSLTVERGFTKKFFLKVHDREDGTISLSIDNVTSVERSDGVKRFIGLCAWRLMQAEPEAVIDSTNIEGFLGEPKE